MILVKAERQKKLGFYQEKVFINEQTFEKWYK